MQPSRNQCTNGTQNPNFVMECGMINPWLVYFPKIEKKKKIMANSSAVDPYFGYFQGKSTVNYLEIDFLKHIFTLTHVK